MAVINGMYIHVIDESITRGVESTSHPVENGLPLTDTVKPEAISLAIGGKIVDYGDVKATEVIAKLETLQNTGSLIDYRGRNSISSLQIRSFETSHPNTISGGAAFSMELEQVRIAKSSYVPQKVSTEEQQTAAKNDTTGIKVGDVVVFKGGPVYVSSDMENPVATRDRSTCEVTHISTASYSIHPYHLISTDGQNVYGWVDAENIENVPTTSTSGTTNAGTQQVKSGSQTKVYHTVKKGDTVYTLVKKYKTGKSVSWVITNNPHAFSRKGDATTLQIGKKLLMGYK